MTSIRMRLVPMKLLLASMLFAGVGCGVGVGPTDSPTPPPTPAQPSEAAGRPVIDVAPPTGAQAGDRAAIVAAFEQAAPGATIRFDAGTYEVGPIVRVTTPELTILGHPDGTTLRGGSLDVGAGFGQFDEGDNTGKLGILHLFEGDSTVRGLTFANSWFGLILGWHYDEDRPAIEGGFVVEDNVFRDSQNGVRSTNTGSTPTVVRNNEFLNVHYGVSTLGNAFVIDDNVFTMPDAPREQGYGTAIRPGAEHVAGGCSDNLIRNNVMTGQETGISLVTDGDRVGSGNEIAGNRIVLRGDGDRSIGIGLRRRADRDSAEAPTGGLTGTLLEGNHVAGAAVAGILVGEGMDGTRIADNTFADLRGPAIVLEVPDALVEGHAPGTEIRRPSDG